MGDFSRRLGKLALFTSLTSCAARHAPLTLADWDCSAQGRGAIRWRAAHADLLVARQSVERASATDLVQVSETGTPLSRRLLDVAGRPVAFLDDDTLFFAAEKLSLVTSFGRRLASWPLARQPSSTPTSLLLARNGSFFAELDVSGCEALGVGGCRSGAPNVLSVSAVGQLATAAYGVQPPVAWRLLQRGVAARERSASPGRDQTFADSTSSADGSVVAVGDHEQVLSLVGFSSPVPSRHGFFVAKWRGDGSPAWLRDFPLADATRARIQRVALSRNDDVVVTGSLESGRLSLSHRELSANDGGGFALELDESGAERQLIPLELGAHTLAEPIDADDERLILRREMSDPSGYCRTRVEHYAW